MFNKNSWISGILIGLGVLIVGVVMVFAIINIFHFQESAFTLKMYMLAIIPNILSLRWFYKTKSLVKTGHGILIITILAAIAYLFWLKFGVQCVII